MEGSNQRTLKIQAIAGFIAVTINTILEVIKLQRPEAAKSLTENGIGLACALILCVLFGVWFKFDNETWQKLRSQLPENIRNRFDEMLVESVQRQRESEV